MKDTSIEFIASNRSIVAYKPFRGWKRDLIVSYKMEDKPYRIRFPREMEQLELDGTLPDNGRLKVGLAGVRGLIKESSYYRVQEASSAKVLISGSGRCGTQAISKFLDGLRYKDGRVAVARHETLHEYILPLLRAGDAAAITRIQQGMLHDIECAPYYALCPDAVSAKLIIHMVRDGRRVVQSGMNRGWYNDNTSWNSIKPVLSNDRFENCCHLWRITTENMLKLTDHTFRLEDIIRSSAERDRLTALIGLVPDNQPFPHSNQGQLSSDYHQWTGQQKAAFATICGPLMDTLYSEWRN